jgi:CheY-like chemotaxis protein
MPLTLMCASVHYSLYIRPCLPGANSQRVPFPVAWLFPTRIPPATLQGTRDPVQLKILIVDDSPSIRQMLRLFIGHNTGWQVCGEAENGRIAIEKVAELKPHAVILDFSMPVMNGLDAAREITRIAPDVQIVMFTMHVSEQLRREAEAAGIKDVISKSDTIGNHLLASLKTICAQQFPTG